jgi:hypothetical protein
MVFNDDGVVIVLQIKLFLNEVITAYLSIYPSPLIRNCGKKNICFWKFDTIIIILTS